MKHLTGTFLLALFFAVTVFQAAEADTRNWEHTDGPYGGSVRAVQVAGGGNILAGTLGSGIYFSTDFGQSWLQSDLDNVSVYDFAHGSGETWFAATQNGVYRSDNNGRSWNRMVRGMDETRVQAVLVHESGRVFAAVLAGGIYVSDDNGSTWSQSNEGLELNFGYALAALPDGSVLAGVTNRIYRSDDGGDSWEMMDTDFPHVRTNAIAVAEGNIFAATQNGVYRSQDNGQTWQETGNQFADNEVYDIVVTSDGLVASTREGMYMSTDHGAGWEADGLTGQPVYSLGYGGGILTAGANPGVFVRN